jgi:phosphate acyltransferase
VNSKVKIVVDAMGGDFAPLNVLLGAHQALIESNSRFEIILAGDQDLLIKMLKENNIEPSLFSFIHAPDIVTMHDAPTLVLKTKKNSSIILGLNHLKEKKGDVFISAGNTGAVMACSTLILGRIKGVTRPTIGTYFPGAKGLGLVVDAGANVDCKPQHLLEFGIMGSIFSELFMNYKNPTVGLLSVGEERTKGNSIVIEANALLQKSGLNFIGNIEGSDILKSKANVIVCDGFVGNAILKFGESVIPLLKSKFYSYAAQGFFKKIWMGMISGTIKTLLKDFDYEGYGGVPLLGATSNVIIGHGKSSPKAIKNMILSGETFVQKDLVKSIESRISSIKNKES